MDSPHITTEAIVDTYKATYNIFVGLIKEVRELSKKKPDAILSAGKVKLINRVLVDLRSVLEKEPESKFLDLLDDEELPQTSDAVLVMVQYESALESFKNRYYRIVRKGYDSRHIWVTEQGIASLENGEVLG
jgi:hypothetical protein